MPIDSAFLQTVDWASTPLGPREGWPISLRGYVQMILGLPTPAIVFWGPEMAQVYNDGYAVIMGPRRHPKYMGGTFRDCWPETYPIIMPWMRTVMDEDRFVEVARAPITMMRYGFNEEAYFTFSLSPLRDDEGKIAGVYQPVVEMTDAVLYERRAETLRKLTANRDVLAQTVEAFDGNPNDVPFAAICLADEASPNGALAIAAASGAGSIEACATELKPIDDVIARVYATNRAAVQEIRPYVSRAWPEPVQSVYIAPIRRATTDEPLGVVVLAISPRLRFLDAYREFFDAIARELGTNLAAQRAERIAQEAVERERAAQRTIEDARAEQARRLATLFENAPVGIAVLRGPDHVFEVANPSYVALVGNRTLLQKPLLVALPELVGQGISELVDGVYRTGMPFLGRSVPITVTSAEGVAEDRFFDFGYTAMPDAEGKPDSVIVVVFDVTDLSRARSEAEAANRAKDEFFAILGHELRNPLAPITTALQLMRLRGDESLARERTIIERHVEQITRLVDDLLDVSRITRGKVTLKRTPLELADVVSTAVEMASPLFEQRRHHLDVAVPPHGLTVEGDPVRLAQVVSNLLSNAAKYAEPGGHVQVAAESSDTDVVLRVTDDGIGIAKDMLPRVFDAFTQEQQSLERAQGGLGLGLTIVQNLVSLHGGTVSAASEGRGRGSTFTVRLPHSRRHAVDEPGGNEAAIAIAAEGRAAETSTKRVERALRVLVVDDNEDAAALLSESLAMLGYDLRVANDGAEAIRVAETFEPDVALLDIGLPVMDGYELAGRLRSSLRGKNVRLVAVTGYGQDADRARAAKAGFDAHVVKPVQLDAVADLIAGYARAI